MRFTCVREFQGYIRAKTTIEVEADTKEEAEAIIDDADRFGEGFEVIRDDTETTDIYVKHCE